MMYRKKIYAFRRQDQLTPPPADVNVFTGSSSIRRWKTLHGDMAPKPVINRGFGGSYMRQLWELYDSFIAPYRFSRIFIYEGDNDLTSKHGNPQQVLGYFQRIEERILQQQPDAIIHGISVKCSPKREMFWPKFLDFNAMLQNYCESRPQLRYIDIASHFFTPEGRANTALFNDKDGIHPNAEGYKLMTRIIRPYVNPVE